MLYYDRIDVSEGDQINKTSKSNECDISYYWYFSDIGFKFQPYVFNGCHSILMMPINFNGVATLNMRDINCRCIMKYWNQKTKISLSQKSNFDMWSRY